MDTSEDSESSDSDGKLLCSGFSEGMLAHEETEYSGQEIIDVTSLYIEVDLSISVQIERVRSFFVSRS